MDMTSEDVDDERSLMQRRIWAVLLAGAMALGGCTDSPSVTGRADTAVAETETAAGVVTSENARPTPDGSEVAAAGTSDDETEEPGASGDDTEHSDERTPAGGGHDAQEAPTRTRKRTLAAVGSDDRGAKVEKVQRRLALFGFAPGPVDGVYGPRTEAAVDAFQMIAGLERTGQANKKTVAALVDYESDVKVLEAGDTGKAVEKLQRRLASGPFDPGPADGAYGPKTVEAVWALEKLAGVPVDGNWGPLDEHAIARLEDGRIGGPKRRHKKRWVEFDLSQQVLKVYDPGQTLPVLVSHGSSGNGIPWENEEHSGSSVTPLGEFVISRRIDGWRESSLDIGRLYNPLYFNGGIAFHGATSVPLYPASHGCVRLPMHIAEYLPDELPNGTPVHILQ
jgi:peptidoglycan hydrolase-like protein with peptidoglycan-binding domain